MATFTNQARLTYNNTVLTSNTVTGEIIDSISINKTATPSVYSSNGTVTYIINLINTGNEAIGGITLSDDLGSYTFDSSTLVPLSYKEDSLRYYVNGVLQPTPAVTSAGTLSISGLSVPVGGNAALVYSASPNEYAPLSLGSQINNTVTLTSAAVTDPVTASASIGAAGGAMLSIAKAISPQTVAENGRITYTFTVSNSGTEALTADDNATISDTFDPILKDITVTFNGASQAEGTYYTYNKASGEFATLPGQLTVPAATYTQDALSGQWTTQPGVSTLTVSGTI